MHYQIRRKNIRFLELQLLLETYNETKTLQLNLLVCSTPLENSWLPFFGVALSKISEKMFC